MSELPSSSPKVLSGLSGVGAVLLSDVLGKDRQCSSAERDAKKKRADASISSDQGTSVVGKQIRAEL